MQFYRKKFESDFKSTHQLKDERLREHDYSCLEGKNGLSHAFNLKVIDLQDIEVFCHQLSNVCVEKVICLGVNFVEKKIHSMNYSYSIAVLFWNCISQHIDIIRKILVIRKFIKIDLYTHTTNFHINSNMWMQNQELQIICVCKCPKIILFSFGKKNLHNIIIFITPPPLSSKKKIKLSILQNICLI